MGKLRVDSNGAGGFCCNNGYWDNSSDCSTRRDVRYTFRRFIRPYILATAKKFNCTTVPDCGGDTPLDTNAAPQDSKDSFRGLPLVSQLLDVVSGPDQCSSCIVPNRALHSSFYSSCVVAGICNECGK